MRRGQSYGANAPIIMGDASIMARSDRNTGANSRIQAALIWCRGRVLQRDIATRVERNSTPPGTPPLDQGAVRAGASESSNVGSSHNKQAEGGGVAPPDGQEGIA